MTAKYDHLRFNIDELIPTFDDMRKYDEFMKGVTNQLPYFTNDKKLTQEKLNEYGKYCQEHDFDGDYLLASLITAKTFELNKGNGDV